MGLLSGDQRHYMQSHFCWLFWKGNDEWLFNYLIRIKVQQKLTCPPGWGSNIEDVGSAITVVIVIKAGKARVIVVISYYDYNFFNGRARIRSDRSACKSCRKLNIWKYLTLVRETLGRPFRPFRLCQTSRWHQNQSCDLVHSLMEKSNFCFVVNRRFSTTWMVTLYIDLPSFP